MELVGDPQGLDRVGSRIANLLGAQIVRTTNPIEAFEGLRWPASAKAFRRDYAATLIAFERRRVASPRRADQTDQSKHPCSSCSLIRDAE